MTLQQTMTKQAASQWLGISRQVIDRLLVEGLPAETDATGRQRFDPKAVARWLLVRGETSNGGPDVDEERRRLLAAQADTAELRLARERGQLLDAAKVHRELAATWRMVRDLMRAIPRSAADRLIGVAPAGRVPFAAALLVEIDDALTRASTAPVERDDEPSTEGTSNEDAA